jgi:hypothetical protein
MAYQLDRFNGTFLVNVEDGSIESNATDLRFVGKNYAGYGEVQNENFLHLLENFSNTTPPPKVISGQIWYDNANKKLKFYDGARFRVAGGSEIGSTAPAGLAIGEFWFDTSAKQLYTWTGTDFVLIGPEAAPDLGTAAATSQVVKDTIGNNHTILKLIAGGKTVVIINQDEEFTLNSSLNPIEDFTVIKKGVNLVRTNLSGVSTDNFIFWGSSSNSLRLGGISADQFVQKGDVSFTQEISFKDPGFSLGDSNDLRVRVENTNEVIFENRLGNDITFRISTSPTNRRDVGVFTLNGILPGDNLIFDLGSSLSRWKDIYAGTVTANLIGNVTGNSVGIHRGNLIADDTQVLVDAASKQIGYIGANIVGILTGSVQGEVIGTASNANLLDSKSPSLNVPLSSIETIPIRSASGDITANRFLGTSSRSDRLRIDNSATDTDPNYRSAKTSPVANSIAARNSSGNIEAVIFEGTATAARYADLAEKYLADKSYEPGTVVAIGGEKEIRSSVLGDRALGVISTNPAFMMNKDLEDGVYVALKGRTPVKVLGSVKKGDRLIAGNDGCSIVAEFHQYADVFAISLSDSIDDNIKIIEAAIL